MTDTTPEGTEPELSAQDQLDLASMDAQPTELSPVPSHEIRVPSSFAFSPVVLSGEDPETGESTGQQLLMQMRVVSRRNAPESTEIEQTYVFPIPDFETFLGTGFTLLARIQGPAAAETDEEAGR